MASLPRKFETWDYDKLDPLPLIGKIGILTHELIGDVMPEASIGIMRFFSLYRFLLSNMNVPAASLRLRITDDGVPIFSVSEMKKVLELVRSQAGTSFAGRLRRMSGGGGGAQHGGVEPTVAVRSSGTAAAAAAAAAAPNTGAGMPASPLDDDPSRSKFWDVFIRTRLYKLTKGLPPAFDAFAPIVFALYELEQIEVIGPLIGTALDSVTLGLPVLGKLMGTAFSKIVSLAPIPYAGPVGDIVAYFITLVFILISSTISISRKQFGTSFTLGLGALPIIGDPASDAALLFEKQVERYEFNRQKIIDSLEKISPHMATFFNYYTPSKKSKTGDPPMLDWDQVLTDLIKKMVDSVGIEKARALIPSTKGLPRNALKALGIEPTNNKGGRRRTRRLRR